LILVAPCQCPFAGGLDEIVAFVDRAGEAEGEAPQLRQRRHQLLIERCVCHRHRLSRARNNARTLELFQLSIRGRFTLAGRGARRRLPFRLCWQPWVGAPGSCCCSSSRFRGSRPPASHAPTGWPWPRPATRPSSKASGTKRSASTAPPSRPAISTARDS